MLFSEETARLLVFGLFPEGEATVAAEATAGVSTELRRFAIGNSDASSTGISKPLQRNET